MRRGPLFLGGMMVKKDEYYFIRPTVFSLWRSNDYTMFDLKKKFSKHPIKTAKLVSILKNHFVFIIDNQKWKMPFFAVEVMRVVNNPISETLLLKQKSKILIKYCAKGFKALSTDELRILLAWQISDRNDDRLPFALEVAANCEPCYRERGDIIRTLRSTHHFRDTQDDRDYYKGEI